MNTTPKKQKGPNSKNPERVTIPVQKQNAELISTITAVVNSVQKQNAELISAITAVVNSVQKQNAELISAIVKIREALGRSSLASSLLGLDEEIDLSLFTTRVVHFFHWAEIKTWRNLVTKSEDDIMKYRNVGKVAVEEIKKVLQSKGWYLDMTLPDDNSTGG